MSSKLICGFDSLQIWKFKKWLADHLRQPFPAGAFGLDTPVQNEAQSAFVQMFPLQKSKPILACKISIYVLQALQILVILAICVISAKPILNIQLQNIDTKSVLQQLRASENHLIVGVILWIRLLSTLVYITLSKIRTEYHYLSNKSMQVGSVWDIPILVLMFGLLGVILFRYIYIVCKQQRRGYVDSRLRYDCYLYRILSSSICVIVFNILDDKQYTAMIIFLFVIACVHCFYISVDTLYSMATRNYLLLLWIIVLLNNVYYLVTAFPPVTELTDYQSNIMISWILAPFLSLVAIGVALFWKESVAVWSFGQFSLLYKNFYQFQGCQEKKAYIWQAVRLISIGSRQLRNLKQVVSKIDWVLRMYPNLEKQVPKGSKDIFKNFYIRFSKHCQKILLQNFKQNEQFKYLLLFFFNDVSAQKMLLFVNKSDFYEIRQSERIQRQHRNSDLAAKVQQMKKNQVAIARVLREYIKKLKVLAQIIGDNYLPIDLTLCQQMGKQLVNLQEQILSFGVEESDYQKIMKTEDSSDKQRQLQVSRSRVLSKYSINLLNLVRREILGAQQINQHTQQLKGNQFAQIINQQDSLIVFSAQPFQHGIILGINPAASSLTCYPQQQLIGLHINSILPHDIKSPSSKHLQQKYQTPQTPTDEYNQNNIVYIVKKNKYCTICSLSLRYVDGTMGKRWIAKLHQIQNFTPVVICDQLMNVIGFSQGCLGFGVRFDLQGINLGPYLSIHSNQDTIHKHSSSSLSSQVPKKATINLKQLISESTEISSKSSRLNQINNTISCNIVNNGNHLDGDMYYIIKITENEKKVNSQEFGFGQGEVKLSQILTSKSKQNSFDFQMDKQEKQEKQAARKKKRSSFCMNQFKNKPAQVKNSSQFEFYYNFHETLYTNYQAQHHQEKSYDQIQLKQEEEAKDTQKNEISPKAINYEDINELIYIRGQLQFRENKKLQEIHTCETHPLHLNHRYPNDLPQEMMVGPIDEKTKIYEALEATSSQGKASRNINSLQFYYLKEHKILIGLLIVFLVISCCMTVFGILCMESSNSAQQKKMMAALLMSQRLQLYFNLATSIESSILINLKLITNNQYLSAYPNITLIDILGPSTEWMDYVKQIQEKSSMINQIDSIEDRWKDLDLHVEIPQLAIGVNTFKQLDETFVDLLQLQQLYTNYPQFDLKTIDNITHITINQQLMDVILVVLQKLTEQILPINLFLISKTQLIYQQEISTKFKTFAMIAIAFFIISVIISIVAFYQTKLIDKKINNHLELFTFFPNPSLDAFIQKLENFDMKINDQRDLTSQIGIEKQNDEQLMEDELLFHKRKIKKNTGTKNFIGLAINLGIITLAIGILAILFIAISKVQSPSILDNWFTITNSRLLESNYVWQQRVLNEGRQRFQQIQTYFRNNDGFNLIPVESLIKNREYAYLQAINLRNLYTNELSSDFQQEIITDLDKGYCMTGDLLATTTICQGSIAQFSVDSFENYILLKQYSLYVLLPESLEQKSYDKIESLSKFFDKYNGKLNDARVLSKNREIISRELKRQNSHNIMSMATGLLVFLGLKVLFTLAFIRRVHTSVKNVFTPILTIARCLPLVMLNRNQPFLSWLYSTKMKELR